MSSSTEAWRMPVEEEDDTHEGGWKRYADDASAWDFSVNVTKLHS